MMMPKVAHLHELYPVPEVINYLLKTRVVPPFDGHVVLASRGNDPKRRIRPGQFINLRVPRFLQVRNMDIAAKGRRLNGQSQPGIEEIDVSMQTMVRLLIATINQRV